MPKNLEMNIVIPKEIEITLTFKLEPHDDCINLIARNNEEDYETILWSVENGGDGHWYINAPYNDERIDDLF